MLKRFIKSFSISTKMTFIYILNCTDILFTYTLLKTGYFYEANFLMKAIAYNGLLSILIKIILPAFLMLILLHLLDKNEYAHLKGISLLVNFMLLLYLGINFMHLYYLIGFYLPLNN